LVPSNKGEYAGKNAFHLKSFSGHYMDIAGGVIKNEGPIIQWDFHGGDNQTWFITPTN
jgi:hypothetical protein